MARIIFREKVTYSKMFTCCFNLTPFSSLKIVALGPGKTCTKANDYFSDITIFIMPITIKQIQFLEKVTVYMIKELG